jgi:threonine dehydratase
MMQSVSLKQAELDVVIEARDMGHVTGIVETLRGQGFSVKTDSGV